MPWYEEAGYTAPLQLNYNVVLMKVFNCYFFKGSGLGVSQVLPVFMSIGEDSPSNSYYACLLKKTKKIFKKKQELYLCYTLDV